MSHRIEVRRNPDKTIDEVLLYDGEACIFHLEQMDTAHWWFRLYPEGVMSDDSEGFDLFLDKRTIRIHRQEDRQP